MSRGAQIVSKQNRQSRPKQVQGDADKTTKSNRMKNIEDQLRQLLRRVDERSDSEAGISREASDSLGAIETITRRISTAVAERTEQIVKKVTNEGVATPTKATEQNSDNRENKQQQLGPLEQQQQRKPMKRMYVPMPGIYVGSGPYPRYYTMTFNEQLLR